MAKHGSSAMVFIRWAVSDGGAVLDSDYDLGEYMSENGDAEVLRWAFERGLSLPYGCATASSLGDLGLLKELHAANDDDDGDENEGIVEAAARGGHDHVLAWAVSKGMRVDESTIEAAAEGGHLATIQFLRSLTPACAWDARTWAASVGHGKRYAMTKCWRAQSDSTLRPASSRHS